jgi:uncharacterized protein with PQ loop repeat
VWFAWHSLLLTFVVIFQMWYYDGHKQMPTPPAWLLSGILFFTAIIGLLTAAIFGDKVFTYVDWLYLLSTIKVVITILKFLPQVLLNIRRKSTKGWNIHGCWMDLIGAVLSILQFILDCYDMDDWNGLAGNFVKLCLGVVSGSYDIIFITQHYFIYPGGGDATVSAVQVLTTTGSPMLGNNSGTKVKMNLKKPKGKKEIELGVYSQVGDEEEDSMLEAGGNIFEDEDMDEFNDIVVRDEDPIAEGGGYCVLSEKGSTTDVAESNNDIDDHDNIL